MSRLFIFDLDGTSLIPGREPYNRLPDFFSEFLDEITSRGWQWSINSTWDIRGQWRMVLVSSVKSRPKYLMGEMGLRLARVKGEELEFIQPYTGNMEERVRKAVEENIFPLIREISSRFNPSRMHFYGHLFEFTVNSQEKEKFIEFVERLRKDGVNVIINREKGTFVAYPSFLHKGAPIREIIRREKIPPSRIVVAGDEVIDLPMMEPACTFHPICPSNAPEKVKEHVRSLGGVVSDKPYAEGVVEAFQKLLKAGKI